MTREELERYRDRLDDLAQRLRGDVRAGQAEALRGVSGDASGNLSNVPYHLADLGSDYHEHEVSLGLLENQQLLLGQVSAALERITQGTFGRCVRCGRPLSAERLDAVPYTPHCVDCAAKAEQGET
jgi:RNA polymerase-binding transcription factor DksA